MTIKYFKESGKKDGSIQKERWDASHPTLPIKISTGILRKITNIVKYQKSIIVQHTPDQFVFKKSVSTPRSPRGIEYVNGTNINRPKDLIYDNYHIPRKN
ncbi:hypothetical protein [Echinicola rosea]|uniref:Uncharacterized protein n=1 Tax=Echinicola rosea TaxID=1807691 RepID=A0ABQ1VCG8_9BACT|nr:hypothetical protein [Echinicola rosea]GGF51216.1 hypothetical protein GCM10011339_44720 [Echinicola rosea]